MPKNHLICARVVFWWFIKLLLRWQWCLWRAIVLGEHPNDDANHADTNDTEGEPVLRIHEEHYVESDNTGARDPHPFAVRRETDEHRDELRTDEHEWCNLALFFCAARCGFDHNERHEYKSDNLACAILLAAFADKAGTNQAPANQNTKDGVA